MSLVGSFFGGPAFIKLFNYCHMFFLCISVAVAACCALVVLLVSLEIDNLVIRLLMLAFVWLACGLPWIFLWQHNCAVLNG